jgi:glycosyltransferase involved in cell wall biosynthesis
MKRKKLLIVTPYMPYPLNSGGNIAQFEMIDAIRHLLDIHIVFPVCNKSMRDFEVLKNRWANVIFHPYEMSIKTKISDILSNRIWIYYYKLLNVILFEKKSLIDKFILKNTTLFRSSSTFVNTELVNYLDQIISDNDIDVAQIEFHEYLTLGAFLKKHRCKKVFVIHELRYVREEREIKLLSKINTFLNNTYLRNRDFEMSFFKRYDKILTVTEHDSLELSKYYDSKTLYASPLTIKYNDNIDYASYNFKNKLFFLGGDDHFPNKEGIAWFLDNCWGRLKGDNPSLSLYIIGNWHEASISKYSNLKDVKFLGFVDSLSDILKDGIFIVPIRIGSGMRMKIIDAVLNGVPFVTTTIGVEGLNFENKIDCLIGDTPLDFNERIQDLINNPNLAQQLLDNAQKTLLEKYSYEKLITLRKNFYDSF